MFDDPTVDDSHRVGHHRIQTRALSPDREQRQLVAQRADVEHVVDQAGNHLIERRDGRGELVDARRGRTAM